MDIKKAIEYAQVALKMTIDENQKENKPLTAKQLSDNIWLAYYLYDEKQIHFKASEINHNLELITN